MFDAVSSALDTASNLLGGAQPGAAAGAAPMSFANGEDLGRPAPDEAGAQAPEDLRPVDTGVAIEFIHFGVVHLDDSNHFPHESLKDDVNLQMQEGPNSRAIMFRAALEREAVLLSMFMNGAQAVMQDSEASKGGLGQVMDMAADFIGGGGGPTGPKASDLNAMIEAVAAAAKNINVAAIEYKKTHQAGIDLHQARSNYSAWCKKLIDTPPGQGGASGLLSQVSAVAGALPGIGNILKIIQGIAFKAFDVYLALFLRLARDREPHIEEACRLLTLQAVRTNYSPVFPVWFPRPEDAPETQSSGGSNTGVGFVDDAVNQARRTAQDAQNKAQEIRDDVKDFFEGDAVECPGAPFLDQAFSKAPIVRAGSSEEVAKPMKEIADFIVVSFRTAIGVDSLPGFLETIISEISAMNAEFLRAMYQKLMEWDQRQRIPAQALYEAARKRLLQKLVNLLISQVELLQRAKDFQFNVAGQFSAGPGHFLDMGEDELNQRFLSLLDPVLGIMMKGLAERLESARVQANTEKCAAMEVYLGLLPYFLATTFRDTFFPFWDILVDNTFGRLGPLGDAVKAAKSAMREVQARVDAARDVALRAKKVVDRAQSEGLSGGLTGSNLGGYRQDLQATASRQQQGGDVRAIFRFPITGRLVSATGTEIKKAEYEAVKPNEKWNAGPPAEAPASQPGGAAPSVPSLPSIPSPF